MNTLKPGLYRATVRNVPDVTVMVDAVHYCHTIENIGGGRHHDMRHITDARPLIFLDLNAYTQRDRDHLAVALRVGGYSFLAYQVDEQTKPARIPEPGWDGKIAAHTVMNKVRRSFVRWQDDSEKIHRCCWADHEGRYDWDELIEPTLIREGTS